MTTSMVSNVGVLEKFDTFGSTRLPVRWIKGWNVSTIFLSLSFSHNERTSVRDREEENSLVLGSGRIDS